MILAYLEWINVAGVWDPMAAFYVYRGKFLEEPSKDLLST